MATAQGGARVAYYYTMEAGDGTISATTPAFTPVRITQSSLAMSANEIASDELRPDRHRTSARRGTTTVAGDITGELSFGTFDDLLEAAFCGSWATDVLKTGTTRRTFAILKRYKDINLDILYRGCEVNQLKLSFPLQEKITVAFSMLGKSEEDYTVPVGATFDTDTTTDFMTTLDGSLSVAGSAFGCATDMNVTLSNNMAQKYSLFNTDAYANKIGMIDFTGDLSAYIEDDTLKTAFRNDTDTAFSVVMTDKASGGNSYTLALPKGRFTSVSADNFSGDDLGIQQLQYRALYDTSSLSEASLTRSAAA
jgi:hypothetical protein